jgi:hypothetical protein
LVTLAYLGQPIPGCTGIDEMAPVNVSFAGEDFFTLFHGGNPFYCGTLLVSFFLLQNFSKIDKTLNNS